MDPLEAKIPNMDPSGPKGRPGAPKGRSKYAKMVARKAPRSPWGPLEEPLGIPRGAQGSPRGPWMTPKEPKVRPRGSKGGKVDAQEGQNMQKMIVQNQ
jgi:hypothetical protein